MKSKNILSRGILPTLQIKRIGPIGYLIVADYVEQMRVYNFSRQGGLIAGDNVDPTPRLLKQLKKTTTLVYQLPKKEPITHLDDSTAQLQNLFRKHLARINHLLGANVIFPYTVIIAPYKKVNPITRNFGCEFKGHRFEMPSDTCLF
ncbi:MAG: hypothetical protein ACFFKA_02650, partial [Candidatus Thorarchaeota archaeon]